MDSEEDDSFPWSEGLFDAHCHPTDTMQHIKDISTMNTSALTIMATRAQDQDLVVKVAHEIGNPADAFEKEDGGWRGVVPSFGWHPWFSHQVYDDFTSEAKGQVLNEEQKARHYQTVLTPSPEDSAFLKELPSPRPLSAFLAETRDRLSQFPAALIGEVGLDRAFRIPNAWLPAEKEDRDHDLTPGGREGRSLSPYRVQMEHQRKILTAQLQLAGELQRSVSVHGVQAHGILFQTLRGTWKGHEREVLSKKQLKRLQQDQSRHSRNDESSKTPSKGSDPMPFPPRVCLHSYSGPVENLKQYFDPTVPTDIYVSFSMVINFSDSQSAKADAVVQAVPDDRILIESDMHIAGQRMDANIEAIARKVCELKGWSLHSGVRQLGQNWKDFVFGKHK